MLTQDEKTIIVDKFVSGKIVTEIAKETNFTYMQIRGTLKRSGVFEVRKRKWPKKMSDELIQLCKIDLESGLTYKQVAEKYNLNKHSMGWRFREISDGEHLLTKRRRKILESLNDKREEILNLYNSPLTIEQICKQLNIEEGHLDDFFKEYNLPRTRNLGIDPAKEIEIISDYLSGYNYSDLEYKYKFHGSTFRRWIISKNIYLGLDKNSEDIINDSISNKFSCEMISEKNNIPIRKIWNFIETHQSQYQICSKCDIPLDFSNFSKDARAVNGYMCVCRACQSVRHRARRQADVNFKLRSILRCQVCDALKGKNKSAHTLELIGCSIEHLKGYIEAQWRPKMHWGNHTRNGWNLDHIVPLESFDLTSPEQQRIALNYKNLQPLWAKDNLVKGDFVQ